MINSKELANIPPVVSSNSTPKPVPKKGVAFRSFLLAFVLWPVRNPWWTFGLLFVAHWVLAMYTRVAINEAGGFRLLYLFSGSLRIGEDSFNRTYVQLRSEVFPELYDSLVSMYQWDVWIVSVFAILGVFLMIRSAFNKPPLVILPLYLVYVFAVLPLALWFFLRAACNPIYFALTEMERSHGSFKPIQESRVNMAIAKVAWGGGESLYTNLAQLVGLRDVEPYIDRYADIIKGNDFYGEYWANETKKDHEDLSGEALVAAYYSDMHDMVKPHCGVAAPSNILCNHYEEYPFPEYQKEYWRNLAKVNGYNPITLLFHSFGNDALAIHYRYVYTDLSVY
ncbi:hypothetical protein [Neptunomonas phycophila]|uniref:hypothetical protein n=2 Tax=Neptunomonas phycophila TaxID=1572645 RepID=UPI0035117E7A